MILRIIKIKINEISITSNKQYLIESSSKRKIDLCCIICSKEAQEAQEAQETKKDMFFVRICEDHKNNFIKCSMDNVSGNSCNKVFLKEETNSRCELCSKLTCLYHLQKNLCIHCYFHGISERKEILMNFTSIPENIIDYIMTYMPSGDDRFIYL
jgi:hypothetical protein